MGITDVVTWYQKKIGTYDKQEWEKTIEQRILDGFTHVRMKSTKLKENLIDLDLVRGSSFTKAKPKHGFITVAQLATLRFILLPYYSKWWTRQTSKTVYVIILALYILQVFNIIIYTCNIINVTIEESENVPLSEIVIPIIMMWILSVIQSQIGATNPDPKCSLKGSFSRKHFRRKFKRKVNLSSEEKSEVTSNSVNEIDDEDDDSECDKEYLTNKLRLLKEDKNDVQASSNIKQNNVVMRAKFSRRKISKGQQPYDDGFESLRSNANSSSDNNDEVRVPIEKRSYGEGINVPRENQICRLGDVSTESAAGKENTKNTQTDFYTLFDGPRVEPQHCIYNRRQSEPSVMYRSEIESLTSDAWSSKLPNENSPQIESTCDSDEDNWIRSSSVTDVIKKRSECTGITTNSSDVGESDSQYEYIDRDYSDEYDIKVATLTPLCLSRKEAVSCTIWKNREVKKAELTVLDISSAIIAKVETMPNSMDYFYLGAVLSTFLALIPTMCRLFNSVLDSPAANEVQLSMSEVLELITEKVSNSLLAFIEVAFGHTLLEKIISLVACVERWMLSFFFFFMLAVAERTFKQRFLYAKFFTHLTSSRRAKNSELPHFRLNKVRNIKTWLSVRSYLKKRGPLRSVDVIVSAAFIITIILLSFLSMELLKDSVTFHSQYNLEAMVWSIGLGIFLLRFLTLGTKINRKYRNFSVLITEQINLYLQIEQKPRKKEELMVANSVLKLAADLLKELESPFKILGLSANPILYTMTKVFILSALSAVLSELLGFKLKLHKIKLK